MSVDTEIEHINDELESIYRYALPGKIYKSLFTNKEFIDHIFSFKKVMLYQNFPRVDQYIERDNSGKECFKFALALAGYNSSDILISVDSITNMLTIESSFEDDLLKKQSDLDSDKVFMVKSIAKRAFKISFYLHVSYDVDNSLAQMKDGLLEVSIPKRELPQVKIIKVTKI